MAFSGVQFSCHLALPVNPGGQAGGPSLRGPAILSGNPSASAVVTAAPAASGRFGGANARLILHIWTDADIYYAVGGGTDGALPDANVAAARTFLPANKTAGVPEEVVINPGDKFTYIAA